MTAPVRSTARSIVRSISFEYGDGFEPCWHPQKPEFACAANAVSLMMPYAEPYIAKSVRRVIPRLDGELAIEAKAYVGQELQHHRQHRKLNDILVSNTPALHRVERVMDWTFGKLKNRSEDFNLAFAAGFETLAYAGARWTDQRISELYDGADPVAASLFLWHLAEEVEHKSVAHDVYQKICGRRFMYLWGMIVSTVVLVFFAWWACWTMLWSERRFLYPRTHYNLVKWSTGFAFELLPAQLVSLLPSHHPSDLVDPAWFGYWLETYDPVTEQISIWNKPGVAVNQSVA